MEVFWNCSDLLAVNSLSSNREGNGSLQCGESSCYVGRRDLGRVIDALERVPAMMKECQLNMRERVSV